MSARRAGADPRAQRLAVADPRAQRLAVAGLAAAGLISAVLCLHLTRGTTLGADEYWFFVTDRGLDLKQLLSPHAGNLIFVVRVLYAAVFALFGPDYLVLRVLEVLGVLVAAMLFFVLARRRVEPLAALALAVPLLFLGATGEITLSPNGINVVYAVCFGLGALLALESRVDWLACVCLALSLATFSVGFAFVGSAIASIAIAPGRGRRAYVVLVPLGLYAVWRLLVPVDTGPGYLTAAPIHLANVRLIPWFSLRSAAASAAAVTGLYYPFGHALGLFDTLVHYGAGFVVLGLVLVAITWRAARRGMRLTVLPFVVFALVFWASIVMVLALNRYPNSARYLYAGSIALLLIFAETLRGLRWRPAGLVALALGVAVAVGLNVAELRDYASGLRYVATVVRGAETGMDLARAHVANDVLPAGSGELGGLIDTGGGVRAYLRAVARWGSPGYPVAELARAPELARETADAVSAAVMGVRAVPVAAGGARCLRSAGSAAPLPIYPPGLVVTSVGGGTLRLARFGARPRVSAGALAPGRWYRLAIGRDQAGALWHASLPPGPFSVCAL